MKQGDILNLIKANYEMPTENITVNISGFLSDGSKSACSISVLTSIQLCTEYSSQGNAAKENHV